MDRDGRVLRFDSLSKVLSAGARLGCVTGPKFLMEKIVMHQMATILTPSGLSQLLIWQYLKRAGIDGFLDHAKIVAKMYEERRDFFVGCLEKYLGS